MILDAGSIEVFAGGGRLDLSALLLGQPVTALRLEAGGDVGGEVWTLRPAMNFGE